MTQQILTEIRASALSMKDAILCAPITVDRAKKTVGVRLVTDRAFTPADKTRVVAVIKKYVPEYFGLNVEISKLTPDCDMVKRRIYEGVCNYSKAVFAVLTADDIAVEKTENGFHFKISVPKSMLTTDFTGGLCKHLESIFCGKFSGELCEGKTRLEDLEVEEAHYEPEFIMPVRTFEIEDFHFLEGAKIQKSAVYLADLNLATDEVVLCGIIQDIRERTYKKERAVTTENGTEMKEVERTYYTFTLDDGSAISHITYFPRLKSIEKIKKLNVGDGLVCTGLNEEYNGSLRYTAKTLDLGRPPKGFVPEKRKSKPAPLYYNTVKPEPFVDMEQTNLFSDRSAPECLKGLTFVVFDLETTGLNTSPASGNMDKIIEIGAFKIIDGEIKESFSTFINPKRKLSDEIIALTGITEDMVKNAPTYEEVIPDFYKFINGSVLVGHNIAGFDYKFIDHYCSTLGYITERKLIDTIPLSQELLFLSNYKLNTIADKFGITFNHHRAIDDALTTAKIFIELIRMKKSLPKY